MDTSFSKTQPIGAQARGPSDFNLGDWKQVFIRTKDQVRYDNVGIVSAGVAFYAFLGLFPLLAALVAMYGLFASPEDVAVIVDSFRGVVPEDIINILEVQLTRLVSEDKVATYAAAISIFIAIWSGSKAIKGMMAGLNIAYGESENRNFLKKNLMAIILTLGGVVTGIFSVLLVAGLPALFSYLSLGEFAQVIAQVARWSLLAVLVVTALSVLYRWGPDRKAVHWKWITPGSTMATIIWLIASGGFSWYVSNFGNYNKTYGSLGAIAVLLIWLSISSFVFLMGAEIDSELEKQAGVGDRGSGNQLR